MSRQCGGSRARLCMARQQVVVSLRKSLASLPLVASTLVPACLLLLLLATSTHFDTRNRPRQA